MLSELFWASAVLCVCLGLVGVDEVRVGRYPMLKGRVSGVCLIGPVVLWGSVTVCCGGDPMGLLFCV